MTNGRRLAEPCLLSYVLSNFSQDPEHALEIAATYRLNRFFIFSQG